MRKILLSAMMLATTMTGMAQGSNTGMGGEDESQSLAERVLKLEKKNDKFNVYFNYAGSASLRDDDGEWRSKFANRELRLEILGHITDKLYYRFRHQLNKSNAASSLDNFAKATDLMFIGYDFNEKIGVQAGKLCQTWGGFEYDENPMFIYQYSDLVDRMNIFKAGVAVSIKPIESQELVLQLTDDTNNRLEDEYGGMVTTINDYDNPIMTTVKEANHPMSFIANWNGNFFDNRLQTRWAWGIQNEGHHKYAKMVMLGQQLNLPKLQWYFDYMYSTEGLDKLGIATADFEKTFSLVNSGQVMPYNDFNYDFYDDYKYVLSDVHYTSLVTKLNWQFYPQWNLMLKGMYDIASVDKLDVMKDYRKAYGYIASLEYYPIKNENLRIFLAYIGKKVDFSERCGLKDYNTNRIELGFMYRMKAF